MTSLLDFFGHVYNDIATRTINVHPRPRTTLGGLEFNGWPCDKQTGFLKISTFSLKACIVLSVFIHMFFNNNDVKL